MLEGTSNIAYGKKNTYFRSADPSSGARNTYRQRNIVLRSRKLEVVRHASDFGVTNVATVKKGENVEQGQHW